MPSRLVLRLGVLFKHVDFDSDYHSPFVRFLMQLFHTARDSHTSEKCC